MIIRLVSSGFSEYYNIYCVSISTILLESTAVTLIMHLALVNYQTKILAWAFAFGSFYIISNIKALFMINIKRHFKIQMWSCNS